MGSASSVGSREDDILDLVGRRSCNVEVEHSGRTTSTAKQTEDFSANEDELEDSFNETNDIENYRQKTSEPIAGKRSLKLEYNKEQTERRSDDKNLPNASLNETNDFEKYRQESFRRLRMHSVKILHTNRKVFTDDNEVITKVKGEIGFIYSLYFSCEEKGASREVYESYQKELCDILLDLNLLDKFVQILDEIPRDTDFNSANRDQKEVLVLLMGLLHNCTDISDAFANAVTRTKVLEVTKEILDVNCNDYIADTLEVSSGVVIGSCHGIVHNTSMREVNVDRIRELDYTTSLAPYLKSPAPMVRISVLATLANIVTEKECEIISNHILVVAQLLMVLNEGMTNESRRCNGWSCRECALAVRQLARNDANKKLLYDLKAMQSLVELAKSDDEEEQLESILGILALSFDDKIRVDVTTNEQLGVVDLLLDLKETSKNNDIKNVCDKTLWNLKDDLLVSSVSSYKTAGERMQQKNEIETMTGHVMISYQRNDRELLLTIKEKLKGSGFKVWMDVDEMGGCVYETMASAVENANIFLMCYSKKYKESENCQYEAKYAHKRKKAVIPLKMERDYEPDGWLGLLLKSDYFIEFSGKYDNDKKFVEMVANIKKMWPTGRDFVDAPVIQKEQQPVQAKRVTTVAAPPPTRPHSSRERTYKPSFSYIISIKNWSEDDINNWLEKNDLKDQGLDKLGGLEISYMARLLVEAPEQLHHCLRKDLKIKALSTKAKVVWALQDLINAGQE